MGKYPHLLNQNQLEAFFDFCFGDVSEFEARDCDESVHYYYKGYSVGGFAGDAQRLFVTVGPYAQELYTLFLESSNK